MAIVVPEVIEISDSSPSPDAKSTPLRPVVCLKNRDRLRITEEKEDCFIVEFDPYDDISISKLSFLEDINGNEDTDVCIVAEKGQVACRDYPHPRYACVKYPFLKTPHDSCCKLCYCYVCDSAAPCKEWTGSAGHCHAFDDLAWNNQRKQQKGLVKTVHSKRKL